MAGYRDELKTAEQKEHYIRSYLGVTSPKSSKEYRSAYQRLRFIEQGKTKAPRDERYQTVVEAAKFNAETKSLPQTNVPPPESLPMGANEGLSADEYGETGDDTARTGDIIYAEMLFQISRDRGIRKGEITVSRKNDGNTLEGAWLDEYWGSMYDEGHVSHIETIVIERY